MRSNDDEHGGTVVEFVDTTTRRCHKTRAIRINGQEVAVEMDSLIITDYGDPNRATKVMLTLLPTEIHFIHDPEEN